MRSLLTGVIVAVSLAAAGPAFAAEAAEDEDRCVIAADRYSPMPEVHIAELLAAAEADAQQLERCVPGFSGGGDCQVGAPADAPSPAPFGFGDARERFAATAGIEMAPGAERVPVSRERAGALSDGYARGIERPPRG